MKTLLILSLFSFLFNLHTNSQDFEVSPVLLNFTALPGDIQQYEVRVKNHASTINSFKVEITDYIIDVNGNKLIMPKNTTRNSCAGWLSVEPQVFELVPNSDGIFKVTISVPEGVMESRWCELSVLSVKERTSFEADISMAASIVLSGGIILKVYQTPKGLDDKKIVAKSIIEQESDLEGNRYLSVMIENTGVVITDCKIYIVAANIDNMEEFNLEPVFLTMMPGTTRTIVMKIPRNVLLPGTYDLSVMVDYGKKFPLAGTRLKGNFIVLP